MATSATPMEGLDDIAEVAYVSGALTLVAYTNAGNSLSSTSVAADITQPTEANGYAAITLNGVWDSTGGVLLYVHSTPTNPKWTATGTWSGTVNGVAILHGSILRHFKDLGSPFVAAAGRKLEIDLSSVLG